VVGPARCAFAPQPGPLPTHRVLRLAWLHELCMCEPRPGHLRADPVLRRAKGAWRGLCTPAVLEQLGVDLADEAQRERQLLELREAVSSSR
jgi:hypothetical protein